jgi:hypothetical protein
MIEIESLPDSPLVLVKYTRADGKVVRIVVHEEFVAVAIADIVKGVFDG